MSITFEVSKVALPKGPMAIARDAALPRLLGAGERKKHRVISLDGTVEREGATVIRLPAPDDLLEIVFDLQRRLLADPASGREELRRIFRDGRIMLVPQPGRLLHRSERDTSSGPTYTRLLSLDGG